MMRDLRRTQFVTSVAVLSIVATVCGVRSEAYGGDIHVSSNFHANCSYNTCPQGHQKGSSINSTSADDLLCYCDDQCAFYQDCCSNYEHPKMQSRQSLTSCAELNVTNNMRTALKLGNVSLIHGYQIVTKCPWTWYDDVSRTRCETPNLTDFISLTPVTGIRNITYQNVYCAICNYIQLTDIIFWTFDPVSCDEFVEEMFTDFVKYDQWTAAMYNAKHECSSIQFTLPKSVKLRNCILNQISSCPDDYQDSGVSESCQSSLAPVTYRDQVYKNSFCATCYGLDRATDRPCDGLIIDPGKIERPKPPAPLSILFGFQPHQTQMTLKNDASSTASGSLCRTNEMFDPFDEKCRLLYCKHGFVLENDRCVPRIQDQENCAFNHGTIKAKIRVPQKPDTGQCRQSMQYQCPAMEKLLQKGEFVLVVCTSADVTPEVFIQIKFKAENISMAAIDKRVIFSLQEYGSNQCELQELEVTTRCYGNWSEHASCQNQSYRVGDVTLLNNWAYVGNSSIRYDLNETPVDLIYTFNDAKQSIDQKYNFYICNDLCPETRFEPDHFQINGTKVILFKHDIILDESEIRWQDDNIFVCRDKILNKTISIFEFETIQIILTIIGTILSLVALLLCLITYIVFPVLRNLPGKSVMSLIATLFTAQLLLLFVANATENQSFCTVVAVILHYVWLASFSWTSAIAFYLSRTLGTQARPQAREHRDCDSKFVQFSVFGWGAPLIILIACVIVEFFSRIPIVYGTEKVCWIGDRYALMTAFFLPIAVALLVNAVLYARILIFFTFRGVASSGPNMDKLRRKRLKRDSMVSLKVAFLMGFTWIFAFIAYYTGQPIVWYVFIVFNSAQGVYIFLAFTCTPQVIALWKNKLDMGVKPDVTSPGERHRMVTRTSSPNDNGKNLDNTFYTQGSPTGTPKSNKSIATANAVIDETAAISNV